MTDSAQIEISADTSSKIAALTKEFAAEGLDRTKEIIVVFGLEPEKQIIITPASVEFSCGEKASYSFAGCVALGLLESLLICDEFAIFLTGPALPHTYIENPSLFARMFSTAKPTHEVHPIIC